MYITGFISRLKTRRMIIWPLVLSLLVFPAFGNERNSEIPKIGNEQHNPQQKMTTNSEQNSEFTETSVGSDGNSHGKFHQWFNRERPRNTTVFYNPAIATAIIATGTALGAAFGWPHDHGLLSANPEADEVFMGATLFGVMSILPAMPFMKNLLAEAVDRKLENDPLWGPVIKEQEEQKRKCRNNFDE